MRINTNIISQKTQESLRLNQLAMEQSMNRLSSGSRINSAADDAAGLAITTRMNVKSSALDIASRNSSDGISLIETAESAMDSITSILTRMRELALAANNGTISLEDKTLYDTEFSDLLDEVDRIANSTRFNDIALLDGSNADIVIQASDQTDETGKITITLHNLTNEGLNITGLEVTDSEKAEAAIKAIDDAISTIADARAQQGASLNRLSFNVSNVNNQKINTEQAASRIADADMAAEMSEMTKAKILTETAISMLSQANQTPQMISQLLQ